MFHNFIKEKELKDVSMKIVSACLAGIDCAYDGKNRACDKVIDLVVNGKAIPVCPEQLGGLTTPRIPAERVGNKVIRQDGVDVTSEFLKGVTEALKLAKLVNCKDAILKANSPSCGNSNIYDGTFTGTLIQGKGLFAKALEKEGVSVLSEEDIAS